MKFHCLALLFLLSAAPNALAGEAKSADAELNRYPIGVEKDIAYLGEERAEKMDIYHPLAKGEDGTVFPCILVIHGGGWTIGDKAGGREKQMGEVFARAGFVAASINYKLATKTATDWPQCLHDCKTAVRFLKKNAAKYRIDPKRFGVIGGSAGGHLALMVAYTGKNPKLDPPGPYPEFSTEVQAVVDLYGIPDVSRNRFGVNFLRELAKDPEMFKIASPVTYLTKDSPPVLILHGTADKTIPIEWSEAFVGILKARGARHQFIRVEGAPHTFLVDSHIGDFRKVIVDFFRENITK